MFTTTTRRRLAATMIVAASLAGPASAALATNDPAPPPLPIPARTGTFDGVLADGATWIIDVPTDWNGTLLLFSHGLVPPGQDNPAAVAPDPVTRRHLLDDGFALAGSSYATTGWAVEDAIADQLAVLDVFSDEVATPTETMAWGSSLGGMVTATLLERYPERFDGGLSLCGPLGGGIALWNTYLDALFVLSTLLDVDVDLVDVGDPFPAIGALSAALDAAQTTPEGRARIALAAAMADIPGWIGAGNSRPDVDDVTTQQAAQYEHLKTTILFGLALRADVEARAGGNPSSNVGVNYSAQLARSTGRHEVRALYRQAGVELDDDLRTLRHAERIAADLAAVDYVAEFAVFDGELRDPMMTLHTNGDQLATVEHEQAYAETVRDAGTARLLRQAFTERAGHCTFTPAETVTALDVLLERVDTGRWPYQTGAAALNARAVALGPDLNVAFDDETQTLFPVDPAFDNTRPDRFLRPFDRAD